MNQQEIIERMNKLEKEISLLPSGSISSKRVNGKVYFYHRVTINKKRTETYIQSDQLEELQNQINKRKNLEKELKELKKSIPSPSTRKRKTIETSHQFSTYVRLGNQLTRFASPVKKYKHRECYSMLYDYVFNQITEKVFILFGLRRTGKTTLIRQLFLDMTPDQLDKTTFIQIKSTNTLSDINNDLKYLEEHHYQYVFIDEVTLLEDFIEGAALFSDIYASSGMKIVLSGTDSLGFMFTEQEQLYDRCILLHTTFIPYREFENVLGIKGIDEYIRYGGTMSMGGINYNDSSSFASNQNTHEYVDSAIARNIQHSLRYYQDGGHFRGLYDLYERNELTNVINKVVEDINHRFTIDVLAKTFKSNDLSISSRNLLRNRTNQIDLNDIIHTASVTNTIKEMLEILNIEEQSIELNKTHVYQIKEYLSLLDLVKEIDLFHLPDVNNRETITTISQPGMRYAQANALVRSLLLDEKFKQLTIVQRNYIQERILSEIMGRMMEDIVLLETKIANPKKQVFQLQFAIGEFDMVISNPETLTCEIYEIKHSTQIVSNQYQHLIDEQKCMDTEHRFGKITNKYVIYRGEDQTVENIHYTNVEKYLKNLTEE